jgi:hypothetical protein
MLALRPCRSVDAAAGQLIAREAGAHLAFGELSLEEAGLGIDERYGIAAAASDSGLRMLLEAEQARGGS